MKSLNSYVSKYKWPRNKTVIDISKYLIAILFIFSGLTKAINPFGMSNYIGDYLAIIGFGSNITLNFIVAVSIIVAELSIGALIILNVWKRMAYIISFYMMLFFVILTFFTAIFNPVSDCGCFGDVIKMSNEMTFIKNIIFLIPALILYINRPPQGDNIELDVVKVITIVSIMFIMPLYFIQSLPLIDNSNFKIGSNIKQKLETNSYGVITDSIETVLVYRNIETGEIYDFQVEDTTWYDSEKWEYVDTKTNENIETNTFSFPILDSNGIDISTQIINSNIPTLLLFITNEAYMKKDILKEKVDNFKTNCGQVFGLSAEPISDVLLSLEDLDIMVFNTDYTLIKTAIQNYKGGAILLENGYITNKWMLDDIPNDISCK